MDRASFVNGCGHWVKVCLKTDLFLLLNQHHLVGFLKISALLMGISCLLLILSVHKRRVSLAAPQVTGVAVFRNSDPRLIFVFLLCFAAATIFFAFMISTFFQRGESWYGFCQGGRS